MSKPPFLTPEEQAFLVADLAKNPGGDADGFVEVLFGFACERIAAAGPPRDYARLGQ